MSRNNPPLRISVLPSANCSGLNQIGLAVGDAGDLRRDGTNIEDLDLTETGDMGDETVGAGANVDVTIGFGFVNPAGDDEVLPEVFASGGAGFRVAVV